MADAADTDSSVVVKPEQRRAVTGRWSVEDQWTDEDILHLSDLLWEKKRGELKLMKKRREKDIQREGSEMDHDDENFFAFRSSWMAEWYDPCASLDNVTMILPMPFTYHNPPQCAYPCEALQIYSVKVEDLTGGLRWPLDVFGMVAVRDSIDRKLNLVFYRSRDNCQTLTEQNRYLALTGPTRAVVLNREVDVTFEVDLKVRGEIESEDRYLSLSAAHLIPDAFGYMPCRSKCSLLLFKLGYVKKSVEATIFVRSIEGSWPDGVHGLITANIFNHDNDEKAVLLKFGADKVPVGGGGDVELSRHVLSVGYNDSLVVSCNAWKDDRMVEEHHIVSKAAANGRKKVFLQFGTCKLQVIVAWSLVSPESDGTMMWC